MRAEKQSEKPPQCSWTKEAGPDGMKGRAEPGGNEKRASPPAGLRKRPGRTTGEISDINCRQAATRVRGVTEKARGNRAVRGGAHRGRRSGMGRIAKSPTAGRRLAQAVKQSVKFCFQPLAYIVRGKEAGFQASHSHRVRRLSARLVALRGSRHAPAGAACDIEGLRADCQRAKGRAAQAGPWFFLRTFTRPRGGPDFSLNPAQELFLIWERAEKE